MNFFDHKDLQNSLELCPQIMKYPVYITNLHFKNICILEKERCGSEWRSQYSDLTHDRRSGAVIPVGARFSALVQTGPGINPATYNWVTGPFPGTKAAGVRC
jgi:hypothetical protein